MSKKNLFYVVVLAALAFAAYACGDGSSSSSPSAPSAPPKPPPSDAIVHEVRNGDITIRFWYTYAPPRNAVVKAEDKYEIALRCEGGDPGKNWMLWLRTEAVDGNGQPFPGAGSIGSMSSSLNTWVCTGNTDQAPSTLAGTFPATFRGLPARRVSAWLEPLPQGGPGVAPPSEPTRSPDAVATESIGWSVGS
jgi:hypothetical protein